MIRLFNQKKVLILAYVMMVLSVVLSPLIGSLGILFAVFVFSISCFFLNCQHSYVLLFAMFPFANIFKLSPSSMSMITICEIVLCATILIKKFVVKNDMRINIRFFIALVLMCAAILAFSVNTFSFNAVIKLIVKSLLIYYFFNNDNDIQVKDKVFTSIAIVLSISMILMMFVSQSSYYFDLVIDYLRVVKYGNENDLIRNSGLMIDPNYCSMAIIITIAMLTVAYFFEKINVLFWVLAVPLFCIGFTTYSKSYFLCALAFLIIFLCYVLYPKHKLIMIAVFGLCIGLVFLIFKGQIEAVNLILARFEEGDLSTGRSYLNGVYLDYIINDFKVFFFGEGYAVESLPDTNNVHNLYIESIFKLGIVGSIMYIFLIFSCFPKKTKKVRFICYLPIVFMLIMYTALAGLLSYELMYYVIICGSSILFIDNRKENNNQGECYETL